jgi:TMEM175 potassium channel family protein
MRLLDRFARGELRLNRIEAFSDGVFAIVVTLLVLELGVPVLRDPRGAAELGHRLIDLTPKFLSWLISFIIVCKFWLNHNHILGLARHADYGMVWLNSIFLMFQSFIPFPTALMGQYADNPLAVSLFGAVMALNTLVFIALHAYILRNLIRPEVAGAQDPHIILKSFVGPVSYLIGVAAAWFSVDAAFVVYFLTPLFFIVPPHPRQAIQAGAAPETLQSAPR